MSNYKLIIYIKVMKNKIIVSVIVGVIIVGGGAFYAGIKYTGVNKSQRGNFTNQMLGNQNGGIGMRGVQRLDGMTIGEIITKDEKSITVKLPNGGSKIIFLTEKTIVTKNVVGSATDLVVNENVIINGSANSDGSINAESIQLGSNTPGFRQNQNGASN
jgi:hypothetical protein